MSEDAGHEIPWEVGPTERKRVLDETEIRAAFSGPDADDRWMWTSIDQYAPNGNIVAQIRFLICPLCFVVVASPPEEIEQYEGQGANPRLDWPERHIDWHVKMGG